MSDIASKYKVSPMLVGRLVKESDCFPEKQQQLQAKEVRKKMTKEAIRQVAEELLADSVPI